MNRHIVACYEYHTIITCTCMTYMYIIHARCPFKHAGPIKSLSFLKMPYNPYILA